MKKIPNLLIYGILIIGGFFVLLALEAQIINASTTIDPVLVLQPGELAFGIVFPQEKLYKSFTITINNSLADIVEYEIKHKPKPRNSQDADFCQENTPENPANPDDPYYVKCYLDLCGQLSETPDENPDNDIGHPPGATATGRLAKSEGDSKDDWRVDLVVPCFEGSCGQDYDPEVYGEPFPNSLEGQAFGCDLWVEVTGVVSSLAGMWHFDEGTGAVAYDSSSNGNNGAVNGAGWVDGKLNKALDFDGTDDYVSMSSSPALNPSSFSYEFWLYNKGQICPNSGRLCRVISKTSDTFEVAVARAGTSFLENHLYLYTGSKWLDTGHTVPLNQWTHITITFDSGTNTLKAYADGTEVYANPGVSIGQSGELSIGRRVNGAGENYKGIIDEVRLYDRALDQSEIY